MVFFHHFSQIIKVNYLRSAYATAGPLAVTVFFLIAGYVTCMQFNGGEDLKNFWKKKVVRLYLPIMIFVVPNNNFLCGLLFMYLVTSVAYKSVNERNRLKFIVAGNILFIISCIVLRKGEWWYVDILPYSVGCFVFKYKDKMQNFYKKHFWACLIFISFPWAASWWMAQNWMHYTLTATVNSFVTCFLLVLLLQKINLKSNLFAWFGNLSWEIFIIHGSIIYLVRSFVITTTSTQMVISIVLTIALAWLIRQGGAMLAIKYQ